MTVPQGTGGEEEEGYQGLTGVFKRVRRCHRVPPASLESGFHHDDLKRTEHHDDISRYFFLLQQPQRLQREENENDTMFPITLNCSGCGNTTTSPHITHVANSPPVATCAYCSQSHPLRPQTPPSQMAAAPSNDAEAQLLADLFNNTMVLTPPQSPTSFQSNNNTFNKPQTFIQKPPPPPPDSPRQPLTSPSSHYIPPYQLGAQNHFANEIRKQALLEQQQAAQAAVQRNFDDALRSGQVYPFGPEGYDADWARAHGMEYEAAWAAAVGVDLPREQRQWEEHLELQRRADEEKQRLQAQGQGEDEMMDDSTDLQAQFQAELQWQQQQQQQVQKPPGIGVGDGFGVVRSGLTWRPEDELVLNQNFYGGVVNGGEEYMEDEDESPCFVARGETSRCMIGHLLAPSPSAAPPAYTASFPAGNLRRANTHPSPTPRPTARLYNPALPSVLLNSILHRASIKQLWLRTWGRFKVQERALPARLSPRRWPRVDNCL
ncbi:hypothetical protein BJ508DRAFT_373962 [Ascobolus immersus RN42]|uniref:Uncharacterized protein n=1 Tax=Ascobolus immersus RN42 TaxID=1160509 RepID=A0A3N4IFP4_ASCIM|nr:hypothetical protein BJ508DRAFT_373962 [Ascobolus immersus RN42]